MMVTFALPDWYLIVGLAMLGMVLTGWVVSRIRNKRKLRRMAASQAESSVRMQLRLPSDQFHQDLVALQIDAVFNGLIALIETERIKLKALMRNNALPMTPESFERDACPDHDDDAWETIQVDEAPINQQIAQYEAKGINPDAMADHLGLSLAEVDLAMKMKASHSPRSGHKLEAVA